MGRAHVAKTKGYSVGDMRVMPRKPTGWEQTPRWHWRYWFGYRMRKWDVGRDGHALLQHPDYNSDWMYRTFGQHARAVLEEQANGRSENLTATEINQRYQSPRRY